MEDNGVFPEKVIPSYDPMNPLSGQTYNRYFFDKFEEALPGKGSEDLISSFPMNSISG